MKRWYQSKTVWTNIAVIAAGVQQMVPTLQGIIPPEAYAYILFVAGVTNVGLRSITTTGLK